MMIAVGWHVLLASRFTLFRNGLKAEFQLVLQRLDWPSEHDAMWAAEVVGEFGVGGDAEERVDRGVGRGAHNDVPIPDDSVSDLHAKLQLRDDGWWVVDMGSTNGTYVGGERVNGEAQLVGNIDVRFGGIKFAFRNMGRGTDAPHGTRVIVGFKGADPARVADARGATRPKAAPLPTEPERIGIPRPLLIALVVLAIVIVFLILQGA